METTNFASIIYWRKAFWRIAQKSLSPITQKVLTQQLRELEKDQLLQRVVYAEIPPKVEYSLTDLGKSLEPLIYALHDWSLEHGEVNQD